MNPRPTRVLFVCLGNICRSPVAECVFREQVRQRGVEHLFEIDSAGTSGYHDGAAPDRRSAAAARVRGIEVEGTSRRVTAEDLRSFDYVLAMDAQNATDLAALAREVPGAKVHRLREWDEDPGSGDVPDPYNGGARGFDEVHDIIERSCERLLDHILAERA